MNRIAFEIDPRAGAAQAAVIAKAVLDPTFPPGFLDGYRDAWEGKRCPLRTLTDPQYVAGYSAAKKAEEVRGQ